MTELSNNISSKIAGIMSLMLIDVNGVYLKQWPVYKINLINGLVYVGRYYGDDTSETRLHSKPHSHLLP